VLQLIVAFSTSALDKKPGFMLKVLEHLLMSRAVDKPEYQAYTDAVKELQTDSMYELRRIAIKMPNQLFVRWPLTS
jgi:exportin-5